MLRIGLGQQDSADDETDGESLSADSSVDELLGSRESRTTPGDSEGSDHGGWKERKEKRGRERKSSRVSSTSATNDLRGADSPAQAPPTIEY